MTDLDCRDFDPGEGEQCNDCGRYTELDSQTAVCEECFTSFGYGELDPDDPDADDALHSTVPDEGVEETEEEAHFRLMSAQLEQAHGVLDAAETTGEQMRIRDAINRKAFEEIGVFIDDDIKAEHARNVAKYAESQE